MQRTFIEGLLCARHQVCLLPSRTFSQTGKRVFVSPRCEARDRTEVEVDGGKVAPAAEYSERAGNPKAGASLVPEPTGLQICVWNQESESCLLVLTFREWTISE